MLRAHIFKIINSIQKMIFKGTFPALKFPMFLVKKLAHANTYEPQNFCVSVILDAEQVRQKKI